MSKYNPERNLISLINKGTPATAEYSNLIMDDKTGSMNRLAISENQAGETITFAITVNTLSGKQVRARLNFYDKSSNRLSIATSQNNAVNEEKRLYVTTTIPEGTVSVEPMLDANMSASTVTETTYEQVKEACCYIGSDSTEFQLAPENTITAGDAVASDNISI